MFTWIVLDLAFVSNHFRLPWNKSRCIDIDPIGSAADGAAPDKKRKPCIHPCPSVKIQVLDDGIESMANKTERGRTTMSITVFSDRPPCARGSRKGTPVQIVFLQNYAIKVPAVAQRREESFLMPPGSSVRLSWFYCFSVLWFFGPLDLRSLADFFPNIAELAAG